MEKKIPTYRVVVNEDLTDDSGVNFISLVEDPAIGVYDKKATFVALSKNQTKYTFNKDKQIVSGPFLIPDLPIYRNQDGEEFNIIFTREEIEKIVKKYNRTGKVNNINLEHSNETVDAYVFENWIIEDSLADKSNKLGFELPAGTWFGSIQINDSNFWSEVVKTGEVLGFSVEALLDTELIKMKREMKEFRFAEEFRVKQDNPFASILIEDGAELVQGTKVFYNAIPKLIDGKVVMVSDQVYSGEYPLENGTIITVGNGIITEVKQVNNLNKMKKENKDLKLEATAKLKDGTMISTPDSEWKVDSEVFVVKEDGTTEVAVDGDYELEDGTIVKVKDGKVTEIVAVEMSNETEAKLAIAPEDLTAIEEMINTALMSMKEEVIKALVDLTARVDALEKEEVVEDEAGVAELKAELAKVKEELEAKPATKSVTLHSDVKISNKKATLEDQLEMIFTANKSKK